MLNITKQYVYSVIDMDSVTCDQPLDSKIILLLKDLARQMVQTDPETRISAKDLNKKFDSALSMYE